LIHAISNSNRLDIIGTDHAPHTWDEKQQSYMNAPSGLPLVQHAVPALMELVADGKLSIETMVRKTSHQVADLFKIKDRGYIREGYWADLVLLEENTHRIAVKDQKIICNVVGLHSKIKRSVMKLIPPLFQGNWRGIKISYF
jgi:dihydroorotase